MGLGEGSWPLRPWAAARTSPVPGAVAGPDCGVEPSTEVACKGDARVSEVENWVGTGGAHTVPAYPWSVPSPGRHRGLGS